jgi:hypothetical protein
VGFIADMDFLEKRKRLTPAGIRIPDLPTSSIVDTNITLSRLSVVQ